MSSKMMTKIVIGSKQHQKEFSTISSLHHWRNGYTAVIEDNKVVSIKEHSINGHEKLACKTKEQLKDLRNFIDEVLGWIQ